MARQKLDRCPWCGKHGRIASDWEQFSGYRDHGWMRMCTRCANRRLNNPSPWAALLHGVMRRVGDEEPPHPRGRRAMT